VSSPDSEAKDDRTAEPGVEGHEYEHDEVGEDGLHHLQKSLKNNICNAVFRIRISLNADPDPGFHFNADPDPESRFRTLKTEII